MRRESRLEAILDLLGETRSLDVQDVIDAFDVSPATARRDLDELASRQLLDRTHGGAVQRQISYDLPLRFKRGQHADEKQAIAAAAAALVPVGGTVGLSGGTTSTAIATRLSQRDDLVVPGQSFGITVVTNAINIASQLAVHAGIRVVTTGGVLQARSYELVGPLADLTLERLTLDVAFIGVNGIDAAFGASVHDDAEAQVNASMAASATRAYLVADSSKIGVRAFARVATLERFHALVTDDGLADAQREALADCGLDVLVAPRVA